jgi:hypothetical protein
MHCALPPSEPPNGVHPCCLRLAAVGGARPRGGWRSSVIARLQGFSSGIPAVVPRRRSPRMMTVGLVVGRSKPGCGRCPALSFKDVHHPRCGGGRAEPGFYLPHGPASRFFLQHSGERALTGLAEGVNFDNAGPVVICSVHGLLAQLALARPPTLPPAAWSGHCYPSTARAAVVPCAPGDRTRRRTPHGRRSCSWTVLSSLRHDASAWRSAPARLGGREWGSVGAGWGGCHLPVRCRWAGGCVVSAEVVVAIGEASPCRSGCLRRRDRQCHLRSGPPALWL